MGIDLDLARDEQLELLARLAPYSIHSEAWSHGIHVYSSSDVGDNTWFSMTPDEAKQVAEELAAAGLVFEEVLQVYAGR